MPIGGSIEPGEGSLDNPSAREEVKASNPGGARDDLDCPVAKFGKGLAQVGAVIDAVGEQMAQPRKQVVDGLDDNPGPIAILDVGGMDRDTHQQARRVGHNMALATFDFFGRIIPSWSTAFGGLDRLAVDDPSRWTGFAASRLAGLQQPFKI